jgi:hypothetical protein
MGNEGNTWLNVPVETKETELNHGITTTYIIDFAEESVFDQLKSVYAKWSKLWNKRQN